jgi:hypothetical protein
MDESEVVRLLGVPDETVEHPIVFHAFYGCLNIQYSPRRKVAVLFVQVEHPAFPSAGQYLSIDAWQIRKRMSLDAFAETLIKESIEFCQPFGEQGSRKWIRVRSDDSRHPVDAAFDVEKADDPYYLWCLSATDFGELSYCEPT